MIRGHGPPAGFADPDPVGGIVVEELYKSIYDISVARRLGEKKA
jgi:hypothetical protein